MMPGPIVGSIAVEGALCITTVTEHCVHIRHVSKTPEAICQLFYNLGRVHVRSIARPRGMATSRGFGSLGLADWLCRHILSVSYEEPTAVQKQCIPPILAGNWNGTCTLHVA